MFIKVNGKSNAFHAFQSASADFSGTGHVLYLEKVRQQGSGINTIKYHTCVRIPNGKVTKSQ